VIDVDAVAVSRACSGERTRADLRIWALYEGQNRYANFRYDQDKRTCKRCGGDFMLEGVVNNVRCSKCRGNR
jgi:DnaJ-class molecular chaperone